MTPRHSRSFNAGQAARMRDRPRDSNPHGPNTYLHHQWDEGWMDVDRNLRGAIDMPKEQKKTVKLLIEIEYTIDEGLSVADVILAAKELMDTANGYGAVVSCQMVNVPSTLDLGTVS